MPRYYFETDDDEDFYGDSEGIELAGPRAARKEALASLPDMLRDHASHGDQRTCTSIVRDASGAIVFEGTLTLKGTWHKPEPRGETP